MMSKNYIRDSVWDSVYHPLWKTVWNKKESCVQCSIPTLDAGSIFQPIQNSVRNSITNPVRDVCFETIEKINNE